MRSVFAECRTAELNYNVVHFVLPTYIGVVRRKNSFTGLVPLFISKCTIFNIYASSISISTMGNTLENMVPP